MPLPAGVLIEVMFGGVFTDVTADVDWGQGYTIPVGRTTPTGTAQVSSCNLSLRNPKGKYTPGLQVLTDGSSAPYWPDVPGTQLRVSNTAGVRFVGDIQSWRPLMDNGVAGVVSVTAVDVMDRLSRVPLDAPLRHQILSDTPLAYWPLTDPTGSRQAVEASGNGYGSLTVNVPPGSTGAATLQFGSNGTPSNEGTCVSFTPGSSSDGQILIGGNLGIRVGPAVTYEFCINAGTNLPAWVTTNGMAPLSFYTFGALAYGGPLVQFDSASLKLGFDPNTCNDGLWHHYVMTILYAAGTTTLVLYRDGVAVNTFVGAGEGGETDIIIDRFGIGDICPPAVPPQYGRFQGSMAHVAIYNTVLTPTQAAAHYAAFTGWAGETPDDRIARFLGYAGLTSSDWDIDASALVLGSYPQSGKSVLAGCQDAAASEGGGSVFYSRAGKATFRSRRFRDPASPTLTVDMVKDADRGGFQPSVDRSALVNVASVDQVDASGTLATRTAANAASQSTYGIYSDIGSHTSYAADPHDALHLAEEIVASNRTPTLRLPQITVDLLTAVTAGVVAAVQATQIGSRVRLSNAPSVALAASQVDVMVEGWTETCNVDTYRVAFDCSPADAPARGIYDDATYGIYACSGQTSHANRSNVQTTMIIDSVALPKFTTNPAAYPINIQVGAEVITLTAAPTGGLSQTFTGCLRGQLGTTAAAITAGDPVQLYPCPTYTL